MPKLQSSLPPNLWYDGYLRKRKIELNEFLKQCHHTKWIRDFHGYQNIFFAPTYKKWKRLRNEFGKHQ